MREKNNEFFFGMVEQLKFENKEAVATVWRNSFLLFSKIVKFFLGTAENVHIYKFFIAVIAI